MLPRAFPPLLHHPPPTSSPRKCDCGVTNSLPTEAFVRYTYEVWHYPQSHASHTSNRMDLPHSTALHGHEQHKRSSTHESASPFLPALANYCSDGTDPDAVATTKTLDRGMPQQQQQPQQQLGMNGMATTNGMNGGGGGGGVGFMTSTPAPAPAPKPGLDGIDAFSFQGFKKEGDASGGGAAGGGGQQQQTQMQQPVYDNVPLNQIPAKRECGLRITAASGVSSLFVATFWVFPPAALVQV